MRTLLLLVLLVAGGCAADLDAYYNANDKIVHRRIPRGVERTIVVDSIHALSRPAVAELGRDTWLAWSFDYDDDLGIRRRGVAVAAVPCTFETATIFDEPQAGTVSTPGLATLGGRLVMAWASDGNLTLTTSPDGRSWTEPTEISIGPIPHVALATHQGRLYAAVPVGSVTGSGGTVAVIRINDDFTWATRHDVIADGRLECDKGVSMVSGGDVLYVAYALSETGATISHSRSGEGDWTHDGTTIGGEEAAVSRLVPALAWRSNTLQAVWSDGANLWLAHRRRPPAWASSRQADVFTPALDNPAGAGVPAR